ncbi:rhodanese-like domain-containing protein [uncultured Jatrophihabitans sp.]|uniref:rhodanese-like domain-containing protein n=1 Tax=uncultured Jatrophihabitans sp. TaxID=1610747 RepID=UPI0035CC21B1
MRPPEVPAVEVDAIPADAVLLDVREDDEWAAGHIAGATHVPMNSVPGKLQHDPGPLTPDAPIVVLCKAGGRSAQVTGWLRQQGYDAVNMSGGMLAWARAHRPMEADDGGPARVL